MTLTERKMTKAIYDPDTNTLIIYFDRGGSWTWHDVDLKIPANKTSDIP